jgi:hypothetical protein
LSFLELANWEIGLSDRARHQPRKCERLWTPPAHSLPRQQVPLTASPQALEPHNADVVAEGRQQARVCRYGEVGEVPPNYGAEILPLLVNRHMPAQSKRLLDLAKLGAHSLSLCLASELEPGAVFPSAAVVCQP